jgi:hypothetical protein
MAHVAVTLRLDKSKATLESIPPIPLVRPGDTIAWTCPDGAITLSFDTKGVFEGSPKFQAAKGAQTDKGKIRADAPKNHFDCIATFNGKPMPISYGFDTSGSGGSR